MNDQIYGLALLAILCLFFGFIFSKTSGDLAALLQNNTVVIVAGTIFVILLVVQLLKEQAWMPDVLKVVAGVVAGSIAAKTRETSEVRSQNIAIGQQIEQAGRDINKIQNALNKIEDSIVNQHISQIKQNNGVILHSQYEKLKIDYSGNSEIMEEYKRISAEYPDGIRYTPTGTDKERTWYDRQLGFFYKIPGARDQLLTKIESLSAAGWVVSEIIFDISNSNVVAVLRVNKTISIEEAM